MDWAAQLEREIFTLLVNPPMSPKLRAHFERLIQSLKHECLDKFEIVARRHLNHVNREWRRHYSRERSRSAKKHPPPARLRGTAGGELHDPVEQRRPPYRLSGLLKSYERQAACPKLTSKNRSTAARVA